MAVRSVLPVPDPERQLPEEKRPENPQWNEAAEQIGSALGRAVTKVREMPLRAGEIRSEVRDRLEVIRNRSQEQGPGIATRLRESAQEQAEVLKDRAAENLAIARNQARRIARERPLGVILAAFIGSFIVGAVLRIWRSSND